MRRLLILIVLLTNTLLSFAQNGLRGRVVEADGTPVIYAAVMLESGNKMVAGCMTGEDGSFLLSGQFSGKYLLKISSIGYKDLKRELECSAKGVTDLGIIVLIVHSYDIDPHSYDVDPLEEGRAFKEQSLFACKQAAA